MIKNKIHYLILLLAILLTSSASAYYTVELGDYHTSKETITRDQFKFHTGPYTACAGENNIIPVWIVNKQDALQFSFKLEKTDVAALSGTGFTLNKDQEGVLFIELSPKMDLVENTSIVIDIFTNKQLTLRLPIEVNIEKCYGVELSIEEERDNICSCEPNKYSITIENKGKSDEVFNVYLEGADFANFGESFVQELNKTTGIVQKSVTIKTGEKSVLTMDINPKCDVSGVFYIKACAELERAEQVNSCDTIELTINERGECYKPKIGVKNIVIGYEKSFQPIAIKNIGKKESTYTITLDAPQWIKTDTTTLSIAPNKEKKIYLEFNPTKDVEQKVYQAKLTLNVGDENYSETFAVRLSEKNKIFDNIVNFLKYYRFYFYVALIILVIILLLLPFINKMKKRKKEVKKQETKKVEEKIVAAKKQSPKTKVKKIQKKEIKVSIRILPIIYILAVLLSVGGVIAYFVIKYFDMVKSFLVSYKLYSFIGLGVLMLLIVILFIVKRIKSKSKFNKGIMKKVLVILCSLIVLAAIVYLFIKFDLLKIIIDFVLVYLYYIITGFVILILIILVLKYWKNITHLFSRK